MGIHRHVLPSLHFYMYIYTHISILIASLSLCSIRSLLTAIEAHYRDPSNPYPGDDNAILFELTPYLESAGFHDPLSKVIDTGKCDVHVWSVVGWSPAHYSSFFLGKVMGVLCC